MERRIQRLEQPHQISPHLYVVSAENPHQWNANAYLLLGEEPTLIDCGSPKGVPMLKNNLEQLGLGFGAIKKIIATHGHWDHIGAVPHILAENPAIDVYVHPGDRHALETADKQLTTVTLYEQAHNETIDVEPIRIHEKNLLYNRQILEVGEHDLYFLHTPGHTNGSGCVTINDEETFLFAGDTVYGHANTKGANCDKWEESLRRLETHKYDKILNGHNWVTYLPITKQRFVEQIPKFKKGQWDPWR